MNKLIEQLKLHEGSRTHAYDCPAGYITIGVGRNIDPNGGLGLSENEINYLLKNDIERCYRELDRFSWFMDLDQVRQEALVNMLFNIGLPRLLSFKKMIASLMAKEYSQAAEEIINSLYARQVGNRANELAYMIERGEYLK